MSADAELPLPRRSGKSESAFRTISEVAEELDVPQHVLRFWEGKFPQVKPLKRGGGRRYYRPEDVQLLRRIRDLLYSDGFTIKGVQKLLREGALKASVVIARNDDEVGTEPTLNLGDREDEEELVAMTQEESDEDEAKISVSAETTPEPVEQSVPQPAMTAEIRAELQGLLDELVGLKKLLHPNER